MRFLTLLLALCCLGAPLAAATEFETIRWEQLVPKDWDPAKALKSLDLSRLQDSDPKAMEALQTLKSAYDQAPAEPKMDGKKVRLPGFVLPLDQVGDAVKSFLLVPYFGACIHTPPPPANQIVLVNLAKPQKNLRTMDAVWLSATLEIFRSDSPWGAVGYRANAAKVEPYAP